MTKINFSIFRQPTIIAIVGQSGSGKTTMAEAMRDGGIPTIVSYTTRKMRDGETNGKEHWFVSNEDMPDKSTMLAYTEFGGEHYWALRSQVEKICTYVVDEKGLLDLLENYSSRYTVFSVYIKRSIESCKESGVDDDRCARDSDRVIIDESKYDYVLNNDFTTAEEFINKVKEVAINLQNI